MSDRITNIKSVIPNDWRFHEKLSLTIKPVEDTGLKVSEGPFSESPATLSDLEKGRYSGMRFGGDCDNSSMSLILEFRKKF
ncbi:MAG: hypothetical protein A2979_03010 [Deltaproteobacteria bacterium RIFCSPLOWO2_01_FULL_45_74]|nr:MAG: hypothetical protein A2712_07275 [Deltaproteobacteria bacterium RIFCSPHIGHO2_01_FULL_43_49]OGQ15745.1 MAG: hypothetical protein A3D22_06065 [Deltaproteobacteria bacterium RIFCSPHIGHO2_02_FULL_44_53]OGQ28714.1 MAG: hypothetical protein A3D98_00800 [Deltaproteobacteria bacterium RIFCSPHIGHO2_12_FULL_44_21]OGQ32038.1 MAG: hypothetical protein A2979_03010 [Deltaproteobacteria bacterium RIFCSPLOWO2_01_FULL_45_74]